MPVETMGRNEQCWCGSGMKYKKCHLDREQQDPINVYEVESKLIAKLRDGYCSHPDPSADPCSRTIAKAHTIQKRGGLAAIAEDGHVLTVKPTMKDMIESEGNPSPRKIGVNNASVFPGFCSKHDTSLFKPIEGKALTLSRDTAFLFAYRAIAYERFVKEAQFKSIAAQREMDRGHSFFHQAIIQKQLNVFAAGVEIGRQDMDRWKAQFDERLLSGNRDDFHFLAVRFDSVLPVVASAAFHPEFDFQGNALQRLGRESVDLEHITLNVTAFEHHSVMVMGWIGDQNGPAKALADSFAEMADDRKANVLLRLLFIQTDNVFLRPSWWQALSPRTQAGFRRLVLSGSTMHARLGSEFIDDGLSPVAALPVETVSE